MAVAVRSCAGQSVGLFAGVGRRPDGFRSAYSTSAREFRDSWRGRLAHSTAVTFGFSIHGSGCRMAGPTECTTTTVFGTALVKLSALTQSVRSVRPRSLPSSDVPLARVRVLEHARDVLRDLRSGGPSCSGTTRRSTCPAARGWIASSGEPGARRAGAPAHRERAVVACIPVRAARGGHRHLDDGLRSGTGARGSIRA